MAEAATFGPPPLARRALVPTARVLLLANELLFAFAAWLLPPLDLATSTPAHLEYAGWFFVLISGFASVFGGWKAACLAVPWRADGSLVWAWGWLGVYAAYGAYCAYSIAPLI
jgi:hypothetical protein